MYSYLLTFTEGILTFISPCILPLLPVYFMYLAGEVSETAGSSGAGTKEETLNAGTARELRPGKRRLLVNSMGFVIGFTVIFVLLGATATSLGSFLKDHGELLRKISAGMMVLFGFYFMGIFKFGFLNRERRFEYRFKELHFLNSILFGMVFAFGWTPCQGIFVGTALFLAGSSKTLGGGMLLLLTYSLGLGVPFLLAGAVFEQLTGVFRFIRRHSRAVGMVSGAVLILAGVLVYTDRLKYLSSLTW